MPAYYNEIDPYAAQWLRNLIDAGHIARGDVDERSIVDVRADDLRGYTQAHFFAGIGGWSVALRLAGWPDDRPVWTGSCPCQPFSPAGKREGLADRRHLWPSWRHLIAERRPAILLGEQVARAAAWLKLVRGDMGALDYALAAMPIEAACAGAQDARDRYWLVAYDTHNDDGRAYTKTRPRQEPQSGSRLCPRDDSGREIRVLGRLLPDASVPLLAKEIPNRLAQYRAFGNAIDPWLAAEFIIAASEAMTATH